MDLYIYSDESGVFSSRHERYFIFGGVISFGKDEKDRDTRKYAHVESMLRQEYHFGQKTELKGSRLNNAQKGKVYRSLNNTYKFCIVIDQEAIDQRIYENKKHKQRYLDFAYKMVLKKCLQLLIEHGCINPDSIKNIHVYVDEHSTATDGEYELRENLLNEFKNGTFNFEAGSYFEPILPHLGGLDVSFCDSKKIYLIRASDIIANHCYHLAKENEGKVLNQRSMFVYYLPSKEVGQIGLDYFCNPATSTTSSC